MTERLKQASIRVFGLDSGCSGTKRMIKEGWVSLSQQVEAVKKLSDRFVILMNRVMILMLKRSCPGFAKMTLIFGIS